MSKEEIEDILEELHLVRPEILAPKAKKLFEAIMSIADERDKFQQENQSLKKENEILKENAENNDKVVDKVNWENMLLKKENKQLKEINKEHRKLNEELREEIQKANDTIDTNIEMIKHLQTIINKAIEYAENSGYEISNAIIIDILKGDSNE